MRRLTGADGRSATRRLLIFVTASVALHLLATTAVIVAPDWLAGGPKPAKPDAPLPSVEFLLVQQEGFGKPTAAAAADPAKAAPAPASEQPRPEPPPPPQAAEPAPEPPPPAEPVQHQATAAPATPPAANPAPDAEPAPEINLGGTDSLSSLIATGEQLIPAAIDAKFRNREPIYPREAARLGQHGLVVVQAHVAPDGHAEAADIEKSSGYSILDNAARDAIITWHFRPAIESGVPVQSTISIGVDFTLR